MRVNGLAFVSALNTRYNAAAGASIWKDGPTPKTQARHPAASKGDRGVRITTEDRTVNANAAASSPLPACDLFIDNVKLFDGTTTTIAVTNGRISAMGAEKPANVAQHLDGQGKWAMPGLYNAHTHAAMTLFRGYGDDMPLKEWLEQKVWPAEQKLFPQACYWGTRFAALEMIRTGTVFFNDMYWNFPEVAQAVKDSGLRAMLSTIFIKFGDTDWKKICTELHARWKTGEWGDRVLFTLSPHAPYTVDRDTFEWIAGFAAEHNLPVNTHLSENQWEVHDIQKEFGSRPAHFLDSLGLVNERFMAAHCVWFDESEFELFAARRATCLHCPSANMKLAVGGAERQAFQYALAKKHGARVALGTDGVCSNNNLDMFEEMKFAALLAKQYTGDAACLPAPDALHIASRATAEAIGLDGGRLAVGALADILLLREDDVLLAPAFDMVSNVVYSANGSCVDTTIVNGRVLMENGTLPELAEVRQKFSECIAKMGL